MKAGQAHDRDLVAAVGQGELRSHPPALADPAAQKRVIVSR